MSHTTYLNLQKKYGGTWVATNQEATTVYTSAKQVDTLLETLKEKHIPPQKTVIGFIEKYGQLHAYLS